MHACTLIWQVLEPCLGGELFERMRRLRTLPEDAARFYAGCVEP